ncbi:MAG: phosphatase PAP2 family protein [Cyclobacteriaceae bacterium]
MQDKLKNSLQATFPFLKVAVVFWLLCILLVVFVDKNSLHLFLNQYHSLATDFFFKYYTHLGDGLTPAIVLPPLILLVRKNLWRNFTLGVLTFVFVPAIVQFMKRGLFYGTPRPIRVFGEDSLHLIEGVEMSHINSFPSGHSAAIFALTMVAAFIFKENKKAQIVLAIAAVVGAYSRVYLSQHFVGDILVGSILGACSFLLALIITSALWKKAEAS